MQVWTCYIISMPSGGLVANHNRNQCITSTLGWRKFTVNISRPQCSACALFGWVRVVLRESPLPHAHLSGLPSAAFMPVSPGWGCLWILAKATCLLARRWCWGLRASITLLKASLIPPLSSPLAKFLGEKLDLFGRTMVVPAALLPSWRRRLGSSASCGVDPSILMLRCRSWRGGDGVCWTCLHFVLLSVTLVVKAALCDDCFAIFGLWLLLGGFFTILVVVGVYALPLSLVGCFAAVVLSVLSLDGCFAAQVVVVGWMLCHRAWLRWLICHHYSAKMICRRDSAVGWMLVCGCHCWWMLCHLCVIAVVLLYGCLTTCCVSPPNNFSGMCFFLRVQLSGWRGCVARLGPPSCFF
jgi:hypothetical protein